MSKFKKMSLIAALESEEQEHEQEQQEAADNSLTEEQRAEVLQIVSDEIEQAIDEISEEHEEVEQELQEQEETDEQIDETADVAEVLESMAIALEGSLADGGLDRHGSRQVQIALEHYRERLQVPHQPRLVTESFAGASRTELTKVVLEDIKELASKAWKAVLAAWQRLVDWARDFLKSNFSRAGRIKKAADAILSVAGQLKGEHAAEFAGGRLSSALAVGGDVSVASIAAFAKLSGGWGVLVKERQDALSKLSAELNKDKPEIAPIIDAVSAERAGGLAETDKYGKVEGVRTLSSKELPGGKAFVALVPLKDQSDDRAALRALRRADVDVRDFTPGKKEQGPEKLKTLSAEEIRQLANAAKEIAGNVERYRADIERLNKTREAILAQAKKAAAETDARPAGEKTKDLGGDLLRAAVGIASPSTLKIDSYALNVADRALQYAAKSAAQYKSSPSALSKIRGIFSKAEEGAGGVEGS